MKLFKIDEYKLYEKYFDNMKVSEFFALDIIPEGVEPEHMKNIAEFLKDEKRYFVENKLGSSHIKKELEVEARMEDVDTGYASTDEMLRDDIEEEYEEEEIRDPVADEEEFDNMLISDVIIRKMMEDGDIDVDELMEGLEK